MKVSRRVKREKAKAERKAMNKHYRENRELGPCFVGGCENNGDFKTQCALCEFCAQYCTEHQGQGLAKAKRHLFLKHPTKAVPAVVLDSLRKKKS
jgi:hypothetical protein